MAALKNPKHDPLAQGVTASASKTEALEATGNASSESEVRPVIPGWSPQPGPQTAFVQSNHFEVVYGGARGGGKTDAALGEFATHAAAFGKGAKGLLLRRTRVALVPTIERAREIYGAMDAIWQEQKSRFVWPSGAVLYVRYLDRDQDADAYQGHDYTRVYVEELNRT